MVEEQQPKVRFQTVDDTAPELLITAEAMRKHDQRPVCRANNLDIVPGVDVHGSSLSRYWTRSTKAGAQEKRPRLPQPQKRALFHRFSSPGTSVHSPAA